MGRASAAERSGARRRPRPPGALTLRAYHEAGHAVVAALRGFSLAQVSIARHGSYGGACAYVADVRFRGRRVPGTRLAIPPRVLRRVARSAAAVALAGSVAQDAIALEHGYIALDRRTGRPFPLFSAGADVDERTARALARRLYAAGPAQREFLRRMRTSTERLLGARGAWRAVRTLASALLRARTVEGARAERIIVRALRAASG